MKGEIAGQAGNDHPTSIPTGVFPTREGQINIAVAGNGIWHKLCKALGAPEWIDDPDYVTNSARSKHRDRLNALISERLTQRSSDEWVTELNAAGIPCGHINRIDRVFADPQVQQLGVTATMDSVPFGKTQCLTQPMTLGRTPSRIVRRPPLLGEYTDEVLHEYGYNDGDIAELRAAGVL